VGIQIVGQPARDLCRHFVQRWNLLIRTKVSHRSACMANDRIINDTCLSSFPPLILRIESYGISSWKVPAKCRSAGQWDHGQWAHQRRSNIRYRTHIVNVSSNLSMILLRLTRLAIEMSDHFIYIENQFFITSTVVDGVPIENGIGDALVNRIIRAFKEHTPWRACIVIPLLPGYTYPIDSNEASSVRLILECQNRTICRGTNSIFSRLRKEGIDVSAAK